MGHWEGRAGQDVRRGIRQQFGHLGKGLPELFHHSVQLAVDLGGRQLLVDGADHGGHAGPSTSSGGARLGTRVSRLAMKWVRQRCQLAPANTAAMAFFSPWWASEVTSPTPLSPRAVSDRRKASQRRLAQKTLHHFSPTKAPGRHRVGRAAVARLGIYPGRPACGAGAAGLLGPGVCGLGGADTLNIGYSLWQDCPCIVPPRGQFRYLRY